MEDEKMKDYKNGFGLICLMSICGILAIVIAIIAFFG
jgi:Tfp pilus assembly major pilin PilA